MITLPVDKTHIDFLIEHLEGNGFDFVWVEGVPQTNDDTAAQILIDGFDYLGKTKQQKIIELKEEGLSRVHAIFPAIDDFDDLDLVREQWLSIAPAARNATADFQQIIDIVQAGRSAAIAINALTTIELVRAYDVVDTPAWPA